MSDKRQTRAAKTRERLLLAGQQLAADKVLAEFEATGEILAQLGADTTLGEDLGKDFKAVLEARQDTQR